jgi:hypothetical protein
MLDILANAQVSGFQVLARLPSKTPSRTQNPYIEGSVQAGN